MENLRAELQTHPIPKATPGSVIFRVLAASVRANTSRIYRNPQSGHALPLPFVPRHTAICRVSDASSDVTSLKADRLIFFNSYIHARDGDGLYISAMIEGSTPGSFMLSHIDIKPGDIVLIAPATGRSGSAAVHPALALGAQVVAIGHNYNILPQLATINSQISTTCRPPLLGPRCLDALKSGARVNLVGGALTEVNFSYPDIISRALTARGTIMSTAEQTKRLIKLVELSILPPGERADMGPVVTFGLEAWEEAWDAADQRREPGEMPLNPRARFIHAPRECTRENH
ncbi:hypothetical protein BDP55DRAFT_698764 [Colletotrichum godetiae]|uniref:Uncharacterized protein n=1 Tax=Colletotrichum godetiae TaxID=1209918 RepID=A0AAJ0A8B1_9PEZI|nr:uncharacterized protein BDP55DRAFT_698764 [Colletotrichum godetiae]KAK1657884.1 hypothetical protein BDP55DRAFT_698764 [Colletotrichum godetiae]